MLIPLVMAAVFLWILVLGVVALAAVAELWSLGASVPGVNCMCCGDMTFELYDGATLALAFSFHHGEHIRPAGSNG